MVTCEELGEKGGVVAPTDRLFQEQNSTEYYSQRYVGFVRFFFNSATT